MNDSVVSSSDMRLLKELLEEKIRKLQELVDSTAAYGGFYGDRLEELKAMRDRLRGR